VVRERRPHLLARDDPLVAVAHRARLQRGEVGPASGSEKPWHQISSALRIGSR
jgi:hypothetical protein